MCNNQWPKRLYALDVSRGIASLGVVLWHWQHFAYKGNSLSEQFIIENQPLYDLLRIFYKNGAMGVQYFFLLSGFIFFWLYKDTVKKRQVSTWAFCIQRFARLYPLHLITLIVVACLQCLYKSREGIAFVYPANDVFHFFLNLGLVSAWGFERGWSFNAPIWAVSIEALLYLVFFMVAYFGKGGWLFCLAVPVFSCLLGFAISHPLFVALAMFFLGGLVFYLTNAVSGKYKQLAKLFYFMTFISWFSVFINCYLIDLSKMIRCAGLLGGIFLTGFPLFILFPLTVLSLALIEIKKGSLLKPLSWIGDITYASYLLHFPLQLIFGLMVSFNILEPDFYLSSKYLLIYFLTLIPIAYVTFLKFERPMQNIIRNTFICSEKPEFRL